MVDALTYIKRQSTWEWGDMGKVQGGSWEQLEKGNSEGEVMYSISVKIIKIKIKL